MNSIPNIFESMWWETTVASMIIIILSTINELLFREIEIISMMDCVGGFQTSCCWECPAWTTVTLIFNWTDATSFPPIKSFREFDGIELMTLGGGSGTILTNHQFRSSEFIECHVCKLNSEFGSGWNKTNRIFWNFYGSEDFRVRNCVLKILPRWHPWSSYDRHHCVLEWF